MRYLNPSFLEYTGVAQDQSLGFGWVDQIHPDDQILAAACWASAMEGRGQYDLEHRLRAADGSYRWFKTRGVPIRDQDGRIVRFLGTCTDIDDHKHTEEKLRASEERLRLLTEAMPQIIWTATPDGICDYFNGQFYRYTGLPNDEPPGFGWNLIVHPDDREHVVTQWVAALEEKGRYDLEYRLLGADRSLPLVQGSRRANPRRGGPDRPVDRHVHGHRRSEASRSGFASQRGMAGVTGSRANRGTGSRDRRRFASRRPNWKPPVTRRWPPLRRRPRSSPT